MSSTNVQDILAFVLFNGFWFSFQNSEKCTKGSPLSGVQSLIGKALAQYVLYWDACTGHSTSDRDIGVLSLSPLNNKFDISSPTDLLVNCAITRSTKLSMSCHTTNVVFYCEEELRRATKSLDWPQ